MKSTKNYPLIRILCLIPLLVRLPILTIAQSGSNTSMMLDDNVIPPSPQAQEMIRYGSTPVSLYTGTPNINVSSI